MYEELIGLAQKAACEWRNEHNFYQAGILLDSLCKAVTALQSENAELRAALTRVEAERDAAVKDLKEIADDTGDGCQYCKHLPCAQKYGRCIGFVWRGAQEEG